jgi:hypothetical protein
MNLHDLHFSTANTTLFVKLKCMIMKKINILASLALLLCFTANQGFAQITYGDSGNPVWSLPPFYRQNVIGTTLPLNTSNDYTGQTATNCYNAMTNLDAGTPRFFIVDGKIYDTEGRFIDEMRVTRQVFGNSVTFPIRGTAEVVIVPEPESCDRYYIIAADRPFQSGPFNLLPYYAILDFSLENINYPGEYGALIQPPTSSSPNDNCFRIEDITPNYYESLTSGMSYCFLGATELIDDTYRLLVISNGTRLFSYRIDSGGGLSFVGEVLNYVDYVPPSYFVIDDSRRLNGELEIVKVDDSFYRIATVFDAREGANNMRSDIFICEIDFNGNLINGSERTFPIQSSSDPSMNYASVSGLEFTPDGRYLYVMHQTNPHHPNPFEYLDLNDPNADFIPLNPPGINMEDYQFSQLEYFPRHIYMINENSVASIIAIGTPNQNTIQEFPNPPGVQFSFNYQGEDPIWNSRKTFHLPDQIDGEVYQAHYFSTIECCISNKFETSKDQTLFDNLNIWEEGSGANPFNVLAGEDVFIEDELIIPAGRTITIKDMTFRFSPKAKVIVERGDGIVKGGRLILDGTTFTVDDFCSDNAMWFGVVVEGHPNLPQSNTHNTQQGVLELRNNSVIEHAHNGAIAGRYAQAQSYPFVPTGYIPGYEGGIIRARNSTFYNNRTDVRIFPYSHLSINNLSQFQDCSFITDGLLNFGSPIQHVYLQDVQGVFFLGNTFTNETPELYSVLTRGRGIQAINSSFTVVPSCPIPTIFPIPCPSEVPNRFTNLSVGIFATSVNPLRTLTADKNEFINNRYGVALRGSDFATITRNHFEVSRELNAPVQPNAGVVLNASRGYKVEENYFTEYNPLFETDPLQTIGVVVQHSGATHNQIYKNTFQDIGLGIQTEGVNGVAGGSFISPLFSPGLQLRCNTFIKDMYIGDVYVESGQIAAAQGFCGPIGLWWMNPITITNPAGNHFDHSSLNIDNDLAVAPGADGFRYYHHNQPIDYVPLSYSPSVLPTFCGVFFDEETSCPSRITTETIDVIGPKLLGEMDSLRQLSNELLLFVDGGDTDLLLSTIADNTAGEVKDALLEASPYLSDDVLLAYIASNPPNGHLSQVLQANSPLSDTVLAALDNLNLPNGISNQITAAQTGVSGMQLLTDAYSMIEHEREVRLDELIRLYLNDTLIESRMDSVIALLGEESYRTRREQLSDSYFLIEERNTANQHRDQLEADYGQDNYIRVFDAHMDATDSTLICQALSSNAALLAEVESIAYDPDDRVRAGRALSMLCMLTDDHIDIAIAPYFMLSEKSMANKGNEDVLIANNQFFTLYPNPVNGTDVSLKRNDATNDKVYRVAVQTLTGQVLETYRWQGAELQIPTNTLADGLYLVSIHYENDAVIETKKLIISKK